MFNRKQRRSKAPAPAPEKLPLDQAPEDLKSLHAAFQGVNVTCQLLAMGLFPGNLAQHVASARAGNEALRSEARKALEAHPRFSEFQF